jgi:hypothetical protein
LPLIADILVLLKKLLVYKRKNTQKIAKNDKKTGRKPKYDAVCKPGHPMDGNDAGGRMARV